MTAPPPTLALALVPVRLASQRLPRKALLADTGRPLFLHTCDRAREARSLAGVHVATDDDEVAAAAEAAGYGVVRTSRRPRTGSERCAEALESLEADVVLDLQGDWPEVDPGDLDRLVAELAAGRAVCNTLAVPLDDEARIVEPDVVKVVRGVGGTALYFSRAPVPYRRRAGTGCLRHIGVYGFTREVLERVPGLPSSGLAETEGLEQLRFLENGIRIQVLDGTGDPWGIETRSDYDAFVGRERTRPRTEERSEQP